MECAKHVLVGSMQTPQEAILATGALLDLFRKILEHTSALFVKQALLKRIESDVCHALLEAYLLQMAGQHVRLVSLGHTKQETTLTASIASRGNTAVKNRPQKKCFASLAHLYRELPTAAQRPQWIACATKAIS